MKGRAKLPHLRAYAVTGIIIAFTLQDSAKEGQTTKKQQTEVRITKSMGQQTVDVVPAPVLNTAALRTEDGLAVEKKRGRYERRKLR